MFSVKFGTGEILEVNFVDERYSVRSGEGESTLTLRITDNAEDLDYYLTLFEQDGALSEIVVTDTTGVETKYTQYAYISSVSRALITGGASVQVVLCRSAAN